MAMFGQKEFWIGVHDGTAWDTQDEAETRERKVGGSEIHHVISLTAYKAE